MRPSSALRLFAFGLLSTAVANPQYGGGYGGNDGSSSSSASTSTASSPVASASSSPSSSTNATALLGLKGDSVCTSLMCIGGFVNGSTIQYTLQSIGAATLGWMAVGFGSQMANTPMVIMWPNSDGTITLSQRKAPAEVMPTVDSSPPRTASAQSALSVLSGSNPKLVFTVPADSNSQSSRIIWAFSSQNPGSSAKDATIVQHLDSGPTTLDLTKTLAMDSKDPTNPVSTIADASTGYGSGTTAPVAFSPPPLLPYEKYIIAHGIISVLAYLLLLPVGALIARYLRSFSPFWFKLHWIIQWVLAFPLVIIAFALGVTAVNKNGSGHTNDTHKQWGVAIFVLYLFQISLGGVIHFFKLRTAAIRGRSVQNYFHAVFGIFLIGVSFYQVRTGFRTEWPLWTGRGPVKNGANVVWIIWLVLVCVAYFGGLVLLPRQYRQERAAQKGGVLHSETASTEPMQMQQM